MTQVIEDALRAAIESGCGLDHHRRRLRSRSRPEVAASRLRVAIAI
jgi:hypothetical protein